ncbi:MAG TPA: hypothetical protein VHO24_02520 [Opitutaceae bacterium]|nr:hypothetical protein [Opitutaceae bacterium]
MSLTNEQVVEFAKKNPISVGCGVLIVALLATAYFRADLPGEAETELEQKSSEAARLAANLKNAAHLKEHFDAVSAAQKQIESRLIQPKQLTTNSQYFYKLESETGVKLLDQGQTALTAAQRKDIKGNYLPTVFTLSVQGDYSQVLTFLRRLENGSHYCRVLTAQCSNSSAERGGQLTLALNLELLGFP